MRHREITPNAAASPVRDGVARTAIDIEPEDVGTAVVTGDVKRASSRRGSRRLDVGEQDPLLRMHRAGHDLAARRDDDGVRPG